MHNKNWELNFEKLTSNKVKIGSCDDDKDIKTQKEYDKIMNFFNNVEFLSKISENIKCEVINQQKTFENKLRQSKNDSTKVHNM